MNKKILITLFITITFLLAACGSTSNEANDASEKPTQATDAPQNTNDDTTEDTSTPDTNDSDTTKPEETSTNEPAKEENSLADLKEEYVQKLEAAKKETEALVATDSSTYALKKVEDDRWDIWDKLLNEIYAALKNNLSPEKMEQLREEQRNWIKHRDDTALEASEKFKGGTQEHLEYSAVAANLTEERCYELVENYMK